MAEPRTSLHMWKGTIILSVVLLNISVRLYTVKGGIDSLLFDRISEKDQIQYKIVSSQPKSIGDTVRLVADGGDDGE